jgi:predicted nucleotidyltransferase
MSSPAANGDLEAQTDAALRVIRGAILDADLVAVYRYGSAESSGLRPDSDLDLLAVTTRRLTPGEGDALIAGLLPISGRETRPAGWRPIELTVVARAEIDPWRMPPRQELQYGEWWREELLVGERPWDEANPDIAILIAMARQQGRGLVGPSPEDVFPMIPAEDLRRAMRDSLPDLVADLPDDTRNVLLTLARMWSTTATGAFRSKDEAADWALERLPAAERPMLARARDLYRHGGWGTWDDAAVARLADRLATEVRASAETGEPDPPAEPAAVSRPRH